MLPIKKFCLFMLFFLAFIYSQSQILNSKQTIQFLNNLIKEHPMNVDDMGIVHDSISFKISNEGWVNVVIYDHYSEPLYNEDGTIEVQKGHRLKSDDIKFNIKDFLGFVSKFVSSKISKVSNDESLVINVNGKIQDNSYSRIDYSEYAFNAGFDIEIRRRFISGLNYLMSLYKSNPKYNQTAYDPFTPKKYTISNQSNEYPFVIKLIPDGNIYKIKIRFGNIEEIGILDTGAEDVLINDDLEKKLIENGYLKRSDYIDAGFYKTATGQVIECRRFVLSEISIGEITCKNVVCAVYSSASSILLGKSFLNNFKEWSIDNTNNELIIK